MTIQARLVAETERKCVVYDPGLRIIISESKQALAEVAEGG